MKKNNSAIGTKPVQETLRNGIVCEKIGMTSKVMPNGNVIPVTCLKVFKNHALYLKTKEVDGYDALVIGYGEVKQKKVTKPLKGFFEKIGHTAKKYIKEFKIGKAYKPEKNSIFAASFFSEGDFVDVRGYSIGKGFAGVMKRWNFAGLRASHGVSIAHRTGGSTGQCQDPGRVFKNKKMPGRLGNKKCTVQNLQIVEIDLESDIIFVKGSVPGFDGARVFVTDAIKKI